MKSSFIAVCATAVVVLASALAETRTAPRLNAASLARVEAVTSYCENVDPASDSEYVTRVAVAMRGHSDAEVRLARNSGEYRQALAAGQRDAGQGSGKFRHPGLHRVPGRKVGRLRTNALVLSFAPVLTLRRNDQEVDLRIEREPRRPTPAGGNGIEIRQEASCLTNLTIPFTTK